METKNIPLSPKDIPSIIKGAEVIARENKAEFKNIIIGLVNKHIQESDWTINDNYTAEIQNHLLYQDFRNRMTRNVASEVYTEVIKEFEDAGWHVFSSTGADRLLYMTLRANKP
jgi:adenine-specific DNA methylase